MGHWEIKYTHKYTGKEVTHKHTYNESNARGWAEVLAANNNCKATVEEVNDDGSRRHIVSVGDKR